MTDNPKPPPLPGSALHFGVCCPTCGQLVAVPIAAQLAPLPPASILRALSPAERLKVTTFWAKHEACSPLVTPCVMQIESFDRPPTLPN